LRACIHAVNNPSKMEVITRFAPSSTGHLHLGHAYSAWLGWQRARISGGNFLLRLEDIDSSRAKPEFMDSILEDLRWLGLDWDGDIRIQSDYLPDYRVALQKLDARGVLYPCFCTRSEISRALDAPHGGEQKYPGTCRHLTLAERTARAAGGANYAIRLNVELALEAVKDFGFYEEDIGYIDGRPETLGDVVLGRRDKKASYHLCVVHDDAAQKISHVTRGRDLFDATHTHVLLQRLLGLPTPTYAHHPLITDADGRRLAKREGAASLRGMREAGVSAASVLAQLRVVDRQNATL
jgi:glutamyl-Q tRNA(Asp) synthetase